MPAGDDRAIDEVITKSSFQLPWVSSSDVNNIYRFGFAERVDSAASLIAAIDSLKRQKVLS